MKSRKLSAVASKTVEELSKKKVGFQTVSQLMRANAQNIRILISKGIVEVVNPEGTGRYYYHLSHGALADGNINGLTKYFNGLCLDKDFNVLALSEPHRPAHFLFSEEQKESFLGEDNLKLLKGTGGNSVNIVFKSPQGEVMVYDPSSRKEINNIRKFVPYFLDTVILEDNYLRAVYHKDELNHIDISWVRGRASVFDLLKDLSERNFPVERSGELQKPSGTAEFLYEEALILSTKQPVFLYNFQTGESMEFLDEGNLLNKFPSDKEIFNALMVEGENIQEYVAKLCKELGVFHYVVKHRVYEVVERLEKLGSDWAIKLIEDFVANLDQGSEQNKLVTSVLLGDNSLTKKVINSFVETKI